MDMKWKLNGNEIKWKSNGNQMEINEIICRN